MQHFNGISVIIRSMDRPLLRRALASVAAQSGGFEAEVIVVAACGQSHRPVPPRVGRFPCRLVPSDVPLNRPRAGNVGLEAARGRHITFLDDDDELLPRQFETLRGALDAAPDRQLVYGRSIQVDGQGVPLALYGGPWVEWRQLSHGFFHLSGMMFDRALLDRGVRFDPALDILEDLEFFVQCAQVTGFHYVPEAVSRLHVTEGSSGTGQGANSDPARMQGPLAYIAGKWSDLARRLEDMAPARLAKGQELVRRGRFALALETLSPLLRRGLADVNVLNLTAMALLYLGNLGEAQLLLQQALSLVPDHPGLLANLALVELAVSKA